jgi:hypothetical protein
MPKITTGSKTVTAAGTRERLTALASNVAVRSVAITAKPANAGKVYVGDSAVSSSNTPGLDPGDTISIADPAPFNLSDVYVDAALSGEGVDYVALDA